MFGKQEADAKPILEPLSKERMVEKATRKFMELALEEEPPHRWIFDVPGTENECGMMRGVWGERQTVVVSVRRKGSPYWASYTKFTGSPDEVVAYLQNQDNATVLSESAWELSASVDDDVDEHPYYR